MWWVCKEAIPAKHNLLKRKILNEDRCEQCGVESETIAHALWNCSALDKIWDNTLGFEDRDQLGVSNITELVKVTHEKRMNTELMALVMWTVWHRRNQLRVNSNALPKAHVLQQHNLWSLSPICKIWKSDKMRSSNKQGFHRVEIRSTL